MWKCNPRGWLYGLPLLALLWLLIYIGERPDIEADLSDRVTKSLHESGLEWAAVDFSGRDGVLTGTADGAKERGDAIALATRTWGVRIIDQTEELDIVRTASPYRWSATKEGSELILDGFVPSKEDRQAVLNMAKSQFQDIEIVDNMEIATGEMDRRTFMDTVGFGLRQLAVFNYGRVGMRDQDFSIEGLTSDISSYRIVKDALKSDLPLSMRMVSNRVKAPNKVIPLASPFIWSAEKEGNVLRLKGHVHSEGEKKQIIAEARRAMPDFQIIDNMEIARGEPTQRQWDKGTSYALAQLAKLQKGSVTLSDLDYSISGHAASTTDFKDVDDGLSKLPRGFRIGEKELTLPKISPYVWRADYHARRVTLSGNVPDAKTRKNIKRQAKRHFPRADILDKMEVGPGAPENWSRATNSSLSQLARLENGSTTIWNTEIELRGKATSAERKTDIEERMKGDIPSDYQFFGEIRVPEPEPEHGDTETYEEQREVRTYQQDDFESTEPLQRDDCQSYLDSILAGEKILFATASAKFQADSFPVLTRLAHTVNRCPETRVEIAGHTDSDGSRKFNEFLSLRRARSVVKYLSGKGVDKSRLSAIGYGEAKPVVPNNSNENKAKNRRIEFRVKDF